MEVEEVEEAALVATNPKINSMRKWPSSLPILGPRKNQKRRSQAYSLVQMRQNQKQRITSFLLAELAALLPQLLNPLLLFPQHPIIIEEALLPQILVVVLVDPPITNQNPQMAGEMNLLLVAGEALLHQNLQVVGGEMLLLQNLYNPHNLHNPRNQETNHPLFNNNLAHHPKILKQDLEDAQAQLIDLLRSKMIENHLAVTIEADLHKEDHHQEEEVEEPHLVVTQDPALLQEEVDHLIEEILEIEAIQAVPAEEHHLHEEVDLIEEIHEATAEALHQETTVEDPHQEDKKKNLKFPILLLLSWNLKISTENVSERRFQFQTRNILLKIC